MAAPTAWVYQIRVQGRLTEQWSDWFDGLTIHNLPNGEATLSGAIRDQAALMGILNQLHALNFPLLSVERESPDI